MVRPGDATTRALERARRQAVPAGFHERFVEAATAEGLVDVAYRFLDSPTGPLLLAATPAGLVRVAFMTEASDEVLGELALLVSPRVLEAPRRLDAVAFQLEEYFAGRRRDFELALDFRLSKGFRHEVLLALIDIAYGETKSYAAVAAATGRPRAMRAVGSACATNPLPLVVPCHRVVRSDGSIGQYGGGVAAKAMLLELEGARASG